MNFCAKQLLLQTLPHKNIVITQEHFDREPKIFKVDKIRINKMEMSTYYILLLL